VPTNKKQTSKRVATQAAQLLANPKTPKAVRSIAASSLAQTAQKRRGN